MDGGGGLVVLLRIRPSPLTWDQARLLRGARPAGQIVTGHVAADTVTDEVPDRDRADWTRQRGKQFRRTARSRRNQPALPAWRRESPPMDGA
jgi:hypothetical protein